MVSPNFHFFLFTTLLLLINPYNSIIEAKSFKPKSLILPITKDQSTNQYLTLIKQRTPLVPLKLTLDLGGLVLWVDCDQNYVSSTYTPVSCNSSRCPSSKTSYGACLELCLNSNPKKPQCYNNTCGFLADNQYKGSVLVNAQLGRDVVSIQTTNGSSPGALVSVRKLFFTCSQTSMLEGLANGVQGMAGLGWHKLSLPSQFSSSFSFPRKFAMCLGHKNGVVFFGDGPYVLRPNIDASKSLIYTPLISNPVSTGTTSFEGLASSDYFIGVRSVKINGNSVPLNTTLLTINEKGYGGTKISTVNPYTIMHTQIYKSVLKNFVKEFAHVPRVEAVAPFGACYNLTYIGSTQVRGGARVPQIDLVLQSSKVIWRIIGANSMVKVRKDVVCLGFVDGGLDAITSIVIGGHQLEDNLLQFDLVDSKLGFSSSLLTRKTSCANFNF